jgi:hypothetical protein
MLGTDSKTTKAAGATNAAKSNWDQVDAARKAAGIIDDEVPAGAFTVDQYAEQYRRKSPPTPSPCF